MIIDKIENAKNYYGLGEKFQKAFEYLKSNDLENMENGKYEILGDEIFVSVQDYQTKQESEGKFEAHKKYADIQFIVTGEEKLGYQNIENCKPTSFYDETNDIVFLDNQEKQNNFIFANKNNFLIFFPQDAHMPCISQDKPTYVKKAVVKIKL